MGNKITTRTSHGLKTQSQAGHSRAHRSEWQQHHSFGRDRGYKGTSHSERLIYKALQAPKTQTLSSHREHSSHHCKNSYDQANEKKIQKYSPKQNPIGYIH